MIGDVSLPRRRARLVYVTDVDRRGAAVISSRHAHARLVGVDVRRAMAGLMMRRSLEATVPEARMRHPVSTLPSSRGHELRGGAVTS